MQQTLNGVFIPENDDTGNVFFPRLEDNARTLDALITKVDGLKSSDITKSLVDLDKANWTPDPDGKGYKQIVSMPSGLSFEKSAPRFMIASGPDIFTPVYLTVKPLSLNSFEIICNDSTLDLKVMYI